MAARPRDGDTDNEPQGTRRIGGNWSRRTRRHIPKFDPLRRDWKPEEDALLGTMGDEMLARRLKRGLPAVQVRRSKKGIPAFLPKHRPWRPAEEALLGKSPDEAVALLLGRTVVAVRWRRVLRGIRKYDLRGQRAERREQRAKRQGGRPGAPGGRPSRRGANS